MLRNYLFIILALGVTILNAQHPFSGGDGTVNNPYQITTAEQLDSLRNYCSDPALHFQLMNDIDLTNHLNTYYGTDGWLPIYDNQAVMGNNGSFRGKLNGRGHKITGLRINRSSFHQAGLFAYIEQGYIDSLGVIVAPGDSVKCGTNTAILAGWCDGATISNTYCNGKVSGDNNVGGMVATFVSGMIASCYTDVEVRGGYHKVGGLVAYLSANSTVTNSYSMGTVVAENLNEIGGLVGENIDSEVLYSYSTADVKGKEGIGGLIGYNRGNVVSCYAQGKVEGDDMVGGLIGKQVNSVNIYSITGCYSSGEVLGNTQKVGGFIGYNEVPNNFSIISCYYDNMTSNQSAGIGEDLGNVSGGIQGNSTTDMKKEQTYDLQYWDFINDWDIIEGCSYPFFRWQKNVPLSITIDGDVEVCLGLEYEYSTKNSLQSYTWKISGGGRILNGQNTDKIKIVFDSIMQNQWVSISDGNCDFKLNILVKENPEVKILSDRNLCEFPSVSLKIDSVDKSDLIMWSTGETTKEISITNPGIYWAEVDKKGCISRDSINIDSGSIKLDIIKGGDLCYSNDVSLKALTTASEVIWSTGEKGQEIKVNTPGVYWAEVGTNKCKTRKNIIVEKNVSKLELVQIGDFCVDKSAELVAETDATELKWNTGAITESILVNSEGSYSVTALKGNCQITKSIEIRCSSGCELTFPTAFNPDGIIHNTFKPFENIEIGSFNICIYNRWGELVYEGNSLKEGWDGKIKGGKAPIGAYVYVVHYLCKDENKYREQQGSFLLVR